MSALRTYPEAYRHIVGRDNEASAEPERLAAARMAAIRSNWLRSDGWKVLPWRPTTPNSPARQSKGIRGYYKYWEFDRSRLGHWFDHPYRLVNRNKGITIFVAEPYQINGEDLVQLAALEQEGWDVTIWPEKALHFPGSTTAVWLRKRREAVPV